MVHHLVIGVIFLVWGIADVLRVQLPGVLARRLEASSEEGRRLWQRLLGVLELIVGGVQVLFCFFSDAFYLANAVLISHNCSVTYSLPMWISSNARSTYILISSSGILV